MPPLLEDFRQALRSLVRRPLFTLTAVAMLAVGLGAAGAVFTLLDALLLRPLDVREPERLVRLLYQDEAGRTLAFSRPQFEAIRASQRSFESVFGWFYPALSVEIDGVPDRVGGLVADGGMFEALGVQPALGRMLTPSDDQAAENAAVLTHEFWLRRFGAAPDVAGKTIRIERQLYTIVGVAAKGFSGLQPGMPCDVIVPLSRIQTLMPEPDWGSPSILVLELHGRLKPGVSIEQARSELQALWPAVLEATSPVGSPPERIRRHFASSIDVETAARGSSRFRSTFSKPLYVTAALVGVLLLIICVNLGGLMLVHAEARRRETAVRLAVGAGRARIFRQAALESALVDAVGALLGLGVASWTSRALVAFWNSGPMNIALDVRTDLRVFGFMALAASLTAVLAGLAPAIRTAWGSPATPMKEGAANPASGGSRLSSALLVVQVAFSVSLLVAALLLSRSTGNLRGQPLDYQVDDVLLLSLSPTTGSYGERDLPSYYARLTREIQAIPGVEAAALSDHFPGGVWPTPFDVRGEGGVAAAGVTATTGCASPGLFDALKTPLLSGRGFTPRDAFGAPKVAVIGRSLAQNLFGDADPLGHRVGYGLEADRLETEIVGVVNDRGYRGYRGGESPAIYTPCDQAKVGGSGRLTLVVRGSDGSRLLSAVRERVESLGVEVPVRVTTLRQQVDQALTRERAVAALASFFAVAALVLAACGLYALLAYLVRARTREIGVRMALGADSVRIRRWIVGRALWIGVLGAAAGVPLALFAGKLIDSLLFGVERTDIAALALACVVMIVIAAGAAYVPARRAATVEPMTALRHE